MRSLLLVFIMMTGPALAQDWVVNLWGPHQASSGSQTITFPDQTRVVVLEHSPTALSVRPLVFVHKDYVGSDGSIKGDDVNLRVGLFPPEGTTVIGSVSRGDRVQRLVTFGDWVLVDYKKLPAYRLEKPRLTHVPTAVPETRTPSGLSAAIAKQLLALKTPTGVRPPLVVVPAEVPSGYQATLDETSSDDRFGPGYRLTYRQGDSRVVVSYTSGGIGDRWFQEPARTLDVTHPLLGPAVVAFLEKAPDYGRPEAVWTTQWMAVPGLLTDQGDRYRGGYLGVEFTSDFDEAEVRRLLASLSALRP